MEQGLLLPNCVQLSRAHGRGVLWDPGGEQREGGISNRFEDTSAASSSHIQVTCGRGSIPEGWEWDEDEPMKTTGGY